MRETWSRLSPLSSSPSDYALVIRYSRELPPVLHGVLFELKAGEKVGLLGRTGNGGSTLAMSFLRLTSPSAGRIIIDGVDICEIGRQ